MYVRVGLDLVVVVVVVVAESTRIQIEPTRVICVQSGAHSCHCSGIATAVGCRCGCCDCGVIYIEVAPGQMLLCGAARGRCRRCCCVSEHVSWVLGWALGFEFFGCLGLGLGSW